MAVNLKKEPVKAKADVKKSVETKAPVKKPVGRPKKAETLTKAEPTEKKKSGRPKKNATKDKTPGMIRSELIAKDVSKAKKRKADKNAKIFATQLVSLLSIDGLGLCIKNPMDTFLDECRLGSYAELTKAELDKRKKLLRSRSLPWKGCTWCSVGELIENAIMMFDKADAIEFTTELLERIGKPEVIKAYADVTEPTFSNEWRIPCEIRQPGDQVRAYKCNC